MNGVHSLTDSPSELLNISLLHVQIIYSTTTDPRSRRCRRHPRGGLLPSDSASGRAPRLGRRPARPGATLATTWQLELQASHFASLF